MFFYSAFDTRRTFQSYAEDDHGPETNYLKASGKGFFMEREGYALAIREELTEVVGDSCGVAVLYPIRLTNSRHRKGTAGKD